MVCLRMHRCTVAHSDASTREDRARQDEEQRGGVGEGSVVLVSLSLTRSGPRDKPLLMEEINFGLNRSPATL